ncbi:MAG: tyrosine-type recombinase/integrase [Bacteroidota bacterium]
MSLKLIKIKRSANWYMRGTVRGQDVYESTGTPERKVAEHIAHKREKEIWDCFLHGRKQVSTFADAVDVYLTHGGEKKFLKTAFDHFGRWKLRDIDQAAVDKGAKLNFKDHKNSSINRLWYDPISAVMHKAAEHGLCEYKRFKKLKVKPVPVKWATPKYFEAFWPYCNKNLRIITTFLPYTGCRITEVLNLDWKDIDLEKKTAFIKTTKTGVSRSVHLPDIVMDALLELPHRQGCVFSMYKAKDAVNRAIRRTVERINRDIRLHNQKHPDSPKEELEYLSTHKLGSHTYATWMMRYAGLNPRQMLGTGRWQDIKSVIRYTHTVASEEGQKADLLPGATVNNP